MKYLLLIIICFFMSCDEFNKFEEIENEKNNPNLLLYIQDFDVDNVIDHSECAQTIIIESYAEQINKFNNDGSFLECDGSGNIKIPSLNLAKYSALTLSFWIKGYVGRNEILLSQGAINSESDSCYVTFKNDKIIFGDPGMNSENIIPKQINKEALNGEWKMLTITSDQINTSVTQSGYKIYIDGVRFAENELSLLHFDKNSTCSIALDFNGLLDNIKIYNKSLSKDEVEILFYQEKDSFAIEEYPFYVSENLISYFTFDSMSVVDHMSNWKANSNGGVSFSIDTKSNKGYSILMEDGYIEVESTILGLINTFSVNFWMKSKERNGSLFTQGESSYNNDKIGIIDGKIHLGNSEHQFDYNFDIVLDNEWHMITLTCQRINSGNNNAEMQLFVDGELESSSEFCDLDFNNNTNPFLIGKDVGTGSFNGYLDNIRFYNKVLLKEDIALIYSKEMEEDDL